MKDKDFQRVGELAAEYSRDNLIPVMYQHLEILIELLTTAHNAKDYYTAIGYLTSLAKRLAEYRDHISTVYGTLTGLLSLPVEEVGEKEIEKMVLNLKETVETAFRSECQKREIPPNLNS